MELQAVSIVTQLKCYGQNYHEIICKKRRKEKETLLAKDYFIIATPIKESPRRRKQNTPVRLREGEMIYFMQLGTDHHLTVH